MHPAGCLRITTRPISGAPSVSRIDGTPDMPRATIVLADDHTIVRSALRALLEAEAEFEVVAEAGDVDEAVRKVLAYKPDVIVLDLSMPGGSSLAAIPRMREASPGTAIVVLTMENEPRFAREALRAGALGFVLKDAADAELVAAVPRGAAAASATSIPQLGGLIAAMPEMPRGAAGRPHRARGRGAQARRARAHQRGDLGAALSQRPHGRVPPRAHRAEGGRSTRAELSPTLASTPARRWPR